MGFGNYRKSGDFPDGLWTNYIEKMIMTDKLQVEVLMTATKASLRSRKIPEGRNIMMQYFHDLGQLLIKIEDNLETWPSSICNLI